MTPILGIDFGQARIGLAISDELRLLAHPLATIPAGKDSADRIAEIARDRAIDKIVIGVPRHMSGEIGDAARQALDFAAELRQKVTCPVQTWDERLTTVAANKALTAAGKKTRETRMFVDQVAAQLILQGYLDSQQNGLETGEPE